MSHVRESCERIMQLAKHVAVNDDVIAREMASPDWDLTVSSVWACDYHFADGTDLTSQYVLVLDALNFCFWPLEGYEYHHLAGSLKRVLMEDSTAFAADKLAAMTGAQLTRCANYYQSRDCLSLIPLLEYIFDALIFGL
jgi:hypothetical protein